ncbi:Gfo/Idh/MocA family protein [Brevibacillus fluminis]|nr:Gfo/Idh/MocA family oxidoreductase [Brevibacillus fluminis]
MTKPKVGIIGLGAIGFEMLKEFHANPDVEIGAVCDANGERARQVAHEFNIPAAYTAYADLLADPAIESVYIGVPPVYHCEIAVAAFAANKHVLCEKPLANSVGETVQMVEAAGKAGKIHAMNFPLNYTTPVREFARLVDEGYLGELRRVEITLQFPDWPRAWQQNDWIGKREQGGFVRETAPHLLQMIQRVFKELPELQYKHTEYPDDPELCERGIVAHFQMKNGALVILRGGSHTAGEQKVELMAFGTKGVLALTNWDDLYGAQGSEPMTLLTSGGEYAQELISQFAAAMRGEPAELYDFTVGHQVQQLLEELLD